MKKLVFMAMVLIIMLLGVTNAQGQLYDQGSFSNNGVNGFAVTGEFLKVKTADTLYTNTFRLSGKPMQVFCFAEQDNDSVRIQVNRQISLFTDSDGDPIWQSDGTVGIDSVTTIKAWADTSAYKDVWHRLEIHSAASTGVGCQFKIRVSED